eukprot:maker-scaffold_19-augustus-gene-6.21-mRNA-1 protein AED:0.02 eAED:0.02 QI:74/1/1/1/0/0.5/2/941/427
MPAQKDEEELLDYDDAAKPTEPATKKQKTAVSSGSHVGINASGFKDFVLAADLQRAVVDAGFEHPSEVQSECVPQAMLGTDVICQAKSGMGKTAVFVLATLHQLAESEKDDKEQGLRCLVLCHTRELAFQINKEFTRFSKYLTNIDSKVYFGGVPVRQHVEEMKNPPVIAIGTPGRVLDLINRGAMKLDGLKHFVVDECDKVLEKADMRQDVQNIFFKTPQTKQVMMFSATLSKEIRPVVKRFCNNGIEVYVDDDAKLTLHGLQQYYLKIQENEKNMKLNDLLDNLDFNQVIIFVKKTERATQLNRLLRESNFPSSVTTGRMKQQERIRVLEEFKQFKSRILVSTDLLGRGIDIERVNIVINYDFPESSDGYLHRVNRAGRFGTKGLAISFVTEGEEETILADVQSRFEVKIEPMPKKIDASTYMNA